MDIYLDLLIATYPMNDYVRTAEKIKAERKEKRKRILLKLLEQAIGFVLVSLFLFFVIYVPALIECW